MWRRPLEWNLNGTTDPRDGSVDHLSLNTLKDRHGPIRAPKSQSAAEDDQENPQLCQRQPGNPRPSRYVADRRGDDQIEQGPNRRWQFQHRCPALNRRANTRKERAW